MSSNNPLADWTWTWSEKYKDYYRVEWEYTGLPIYVWASELGPSRSDSGSYSFTSTSSAASQQYQSQTEDISPSSNLSPACMEASINQTTRRGNVYMDSSLRVMSDQRQPNATTDMDLSNSLYEDLLAQSLLNESLGGAENQPEPSPVVSEDLCRASSNHSKPDTFTEKLPTPNPGALEGEPSKDKGIDSAMAATLSSSGTPATEDGALTTTSEYATTSSCRQFSTSSTEAYEQAKLRLWEDFQGETGETFSTPDDSDPGDLSSTADFSITNDLEEEGESLHPRDEQDMRFVRPKMWRSRLESTHEEVLRESGTYTSLSGSNLKLEDYVQWIRACACRIEENLQRLKQARLCDQAINLLVIHRSRPDVAELLRIRSSQIAFVKGFRDIDAGGMHLATHQCHEFLLEVSLSPDGSVHVTDSVNFVLAVMKIIDLAIVAYSGAHLESMDIFCKRQSGGQVIEIADWILFRRRTLRCLNPYLKAPVWTLQVLLEEANTYSVAQQPAPVYLSTTIEEFATIWGPVWKQSSKDNDKATLRYDTGPGFIIPWPRSGAEPLLMADEVFCHWSDDENVLSDYGSFPKPEHKQQRLLIGGRLSRNGACTSTGDDFELRMVDEGRRHVLGVNHARYESESQTICTQIGGFALQAGLQEEYRRIGSSYRDDLLAAWTHPPFQRNPAAFRHWFGVEISSCTGNARRRRLSHILGSTTMRNYLESVGMVWPSETCKANYFNSLRSEDFQEFKSLFLDEKSRKTVTDALGLCLKAILKTKLDKNNVLSAMWMPDTTEAHTITFEPWEHSWTGILTDGPDGCNVAIVSEVCLELRDCSQPLLCRSKRSESGVCTIFESKLVINELAECPEALRKRHRRHSRDTSDFMYDWDFARTEGETFDLGQQGRLEILRYLRRTEEHRDRGLLAEWKPQPGSSRMEVAKETLRQSIGKSPVKKSPREYIWEHPYKAKPILVQITSHPNMVDLPVRTRA